MDTKKGYCYETESTDEGSRTEGKIKRLSKDVRIHVKYIHNYEMFSHEWVELVDSLKQIAHLALSEKKVPMMHKDLSSIHGRKKHGTLWDQEKSELAIRIVLEEGKLNLCMRLLSELMKSKSLPNFYTVLECACVDGPYSTDQMEKILSTIEKSLGIIVLLCIQHVESLQICDNGTLLDLCARTLGADHDVNELKRMNRAKRLYGTSLKSLDKLQLNIAFFYLYHLIRHIPDISEASLMQIIQEKRIIRKLISSVRKYRQYLPHETLAIAAKFLHHVFQTDTFQTNMKKFQYKAFDEDIIDFREGLNNVIELKFLQESEISSITSYVYTLQREEKVAKVRTEQKPWDNLVDLIQSTDLGEE